ncbi:hypothetical protein [Streptosporangium saharense]|uniref:Putative nucleic acid-binding Zn-ribbon protein n=1 Tax=Streptosporangium saharense TaxID=1706840 RepID=A0A7W7QWC1_9ACTN|nr:hypothetical protein [Streptosporangium saharense]MBB4920942.1 putative nucleic acid-binding Zn-ribbon protein [Streptosporangium saharense]
MFGISLRRRDAADDGQAVNGHDHDQAKAPLSPWTEGSGVREIRHYRVSPKGRPDRGDRLSGALLVTAGVIISAALAGAAVVAYDAQMRFAAANLPADHAAVSAPIVAALPDAGWVAMALVALVAALRGRSSLRARIGVLIFFGLSLGAQLLYAAPTVPSILVAVIAPVSLAWMLETLIVEVRRWAAARTGLDVSETPILTALLAGAWRLLRGLVGLMLWGIRLLLDRRGTWGGVRDWVLDTAPLAPGRTRASLAAAAALEQAGAAERQAELTAARADELVAAERAEMAARLDQVEAQIKAERAQLQEAQRDLAERLAETERAARDEERTAAAEQLAELRTELTEVRADADQERDRLVATVEAVREAERARSRKALAAERAEMDLVVESLRLAREECNRLAELASVPTGKARLLALYDRLQGVDSRYGDLDQAAALARELYEQAGLRSEGTARSYLYEHIKSSKADQMSVQGGMIEAGSQS